MSQAALNGIMGYKSGTQGESPYVNLPVDSRNPGRDSQTRTISHTPAPGDKAPQMQRGNSLILPGS